MLLSIPEPAKYFCEADEEHFFGWLQGLPAVKSVAGTPTGLDVTIETPIDKLSFYELAGLLTRYQLPLTSLRVLCADQRDPWFHDAQNYWYAAVFG